MLNNNEFKKNNFKLIKKKIKYLGLDNIILVKGSFIKSFKKYSKCKFMGGIIDCDLYNSYKQCLNFFSPRLSRNGEIFLDEYYSLKYPGARLACDEFATLNKNFILEKYKKIQGEFERWKLKKVL